MKLWIIILIASVCAIAEVLVIVDAVIHKDEWQINFVQEYKDYIREQRKEAINE